MVRYGQCVQRHVPARTFLPGNCRSNPLFWRFVDSGKALANILIEFSEIVSKEHRNELFLEEPSSGPSWSSTHPVINDCAGVGAEKREDAKRSRTPFQRRGHSL